MAQTERAILLVNAIVTRLRGLRATNAMQAASLGVPFRKAERTTAMRLAGDRCD
jgi:hypothetical protein